jgi:hypothetical protein
MLVNYRQPENMCEIKQNECGYFIRISPSDLKQVMELIMYGTQMRQISSLSTFLNYLMLFKVSFFPLFP